MAISSLNEGGTLVSIQLPKILARMRAVIIEDELNVREGFIKLMKTFCPEISVVVWRIL